MIQDYEQELTVDGGHDLDGFAAGTAYGARPYDRMAAGGDDGVGEKLAAYMQIVGADTDLLTSLAVALVTDTDGAGGSAVVLCTKTFLAAALLVANGVQFVGYADPLVAMKRYLTARLVVVGTTPTADSYCKVWFEKGDDRVPHNSGLTID